MATKEPKLDSFATPGMNVEVFSLDRLAPELVGKKIQATLQLTGDTRAVRWWISNIQPLLQSWPLTDLHAQEPIPRELQSSDRFRMYFEENQEPALLSGSHLRR